MKRVEVEEFDGSRSGLTGLSAWERQVALHMSLGRSDEQIARIYGNCPELIAEMRTRTDISDHLAMLDVQRVESMMTRKTAADRILDKTLDALSNLLDRYCENPKVLNPREILSLTNLITQIHPDGQFRKHTKVDHTVAVNNTYDAVAQLKAAGRQFNLPAPTPVTVIDVTPVE